MDKYVIPNLANACRMMELLAGGESLSASELARRLEIPRTTAFRILQTLVGQGYCEAVNGSYRMGPMLLGLGLQALGSFKLRERALPVLKQLSADTGETSHLAVLSGGSGLIVEVYDSPNALRVASRSGTLVDLHCAATGKAICSTMEWEDVLRIVGDGPYRSRTRRTLTTPKAFRADLRKAQARGYAIDDEEYHDGVRCIGAPILQGPPPAVAAIGITGAALRLTKSRLAEVAQQVKLAAEQLSFGAVGGVSRWEPVRGSAK
jgi:DNA-binding IclR family transcriptional regulator